MIHLYAVALLLQTALEYQPPEPMLEGIATGSQQVQILHTWFATWDDRQSMVQRAYDLWWLDFVLMIECENWGWNPKAKWDSWRSYGLCQMNTRWHKLSQEYYNSWEYQIEYCYQKRKGWTRYYWPDRIIKWMKCKDYVKDRFIFIHKADEKI